jgi:SSS family solute:Na+ symporter
VVGLREQQRDFYEGRVSAAAKAALLSRRQHLTWPVIGLAMFAANISTVHLVSLAETAYKFGLVSAASSGRVHLILLSLFFAPLYLRSRVATLPDFLERRFNRGCRDVLRRVALLGHCHSHGCGVVHAAGLARHPRTPPGGTILGVDALLVFILALGSHGHLHDARRPACGGLDESVQTILLPGGRRRHPGRVPESRGWDASRRRSLLIPSAGKRG